MASGQPHQFEEVLTSPEESDTRTFLSIKSPLRDATGTVTGVVSVSTNITQLKHATLELAEARARHESAMRAARIGTWELDFATGRLTFDRIYFELHGLEPSPDFFYEDWLARVAPEDRVAADTAVKLLMAGKAEPSSTSFALFCQTAAAAGSPVKARFCTAVASRRRGCSGSATTSPRIRKLRNDYCF